MNNNLKYIILNHSIEPIHIIGCDGDSYYYTYSYISCEDSAWCNDVYDTIEEAERELIKDIEKHITNLTKDITLFNNKLILLKQKHLK